MSSESWSKSDLIPKGLSSPDKKSKEYKNALKVSGKQQSTKKGMGKDSIFGDSKRSCKIFISKSDIDKADKDIKASLKAYTDKFETAKKTAEDNKKSAIDTANKTLDDAMEKLINGSSESASIEDQIKSIVTELETKMTEIQKEFNDKAIESVNKYNTAESNIVDEHAKKIDPVLEKFGKQGDLYYFGKEFKEIVEKAAEQAKESVTAQVAGAQAQEAIEEEKVDETTKNVNNDALYQAFKATADIKLECENVKEGEECTPEQFKSNVSDAISKNVGVIIESAKKAIADKDKKTNPSKTLNSKEIEVSVKKLESAIADQLKQHQESIKENTTVFSKRRAKMDSVVDNLNKVITDSTKNTIAKLDNAKKTLNDALSSLSKTRDSKIKSQMNATISSLQKKLNDLNNKANSLVDANNKAIKDAENKEKDAIKNAQTELDNNMKGYQLKLSINGVAYYHSTVGGLFGKKSQHEECKILGIKSSDKSGSKLEVEYLRKGEKKSQTTAITNVCVLKQ